MWAAKLVLGLQPYRIRYVHLYDNSARQIAQLQMMKKDHLREMRVNDPQMKRTIRVTRGDFNQEVLNLAHLRTIRPNQATFCLLDQRTRECDWNTVEVLANYKTKGNKIELFYFLPVGWLGRAMAAIKHDPAGKMTRWWGRSDWEILRGKHHIDLAQIFCERFRGLGYNFVHCYAIRDKLYGGRVMYYMIHATDHPEAPELMGRAYRTVVRPKPPVQLELVMELKE